MTGFGILFSAPMVRALLAGTKTQTRRVLNPQPADDGLYHELKPAYRALRIAPSDRLWLREAWRCEARYDDFAPSELPRGAPIYYAADLNPRDSEPGCAGRLRASMHMPRWASRLTLLVTERRVQRLQDISVEDAIAEGVVEDDGSEPDIFYLPGSHMISGINAARKRAHPIGSHPDPRLVYRDLVNNLHDGDLWSANPWVAAYTFSVHQQNIDAAERLAS